MFTPLNSLRRAAQALVLVTMFSTAAAQPAVNGPALSAPTAVATAGEQSLADKRAENEKQLRLAQSKLETAIPSDPAAAQQVAHFQAVAAVHAQQDAVAQQINDLQARKTEFENQLKLPLAEPKPAAVTHSFIELDRLKDDLAAEESKASLVDDRLIAAQAAFERAQRAREESEVKRRQAKEAADSAAGAANAAELATAAEQAQQAAALASEAAALRKRELERDKLAREVQQLAVRVCQERVARFGSLVIFSQAEFDDQLAQIKKKEDSANRSLTSAQNRLHSTDVQLRETQQQLQAETGDRTVLTEMLEARRRARERYSDDVDSLTQRLGRLAQLRVAWSRRFQTAAARASDAGDSSAEAIDWGQLKGWQSETRSVLDELAADLRTQIYCVRTLRSSLTSLTKKLDAAKELAVKEPTNTITASSITWLEEQRRHVEATLRIHETNMVTIETSRRVHEKLLDELGRGVLALTPTNLALGAWHQAKGIWYFEITNIGDTPIFIGKVIYFLAVVIGGWIAARVLSTVFANRFLKRFRLSKDATAAVRTLAFYTMMAMVALYALKEINVPLTALTMLGGALAIGVGFGSQALVNNFIGGLIMLAERPVRLGERIIFGNFDGVVEDVGFRCTKLRTASDHLITIPNSTLVNDSIENAARRRTIRRVCNITIATDTPRDRVASAVQVIRDILAEKDIRERIHPIVGFEEFPPRVYFNEFKLDSFNIQIVYWYAPPSWWEYMEHSERVNLRIMEEFERLGVYFAAPPRMLTLPSQAASHDLAA
jgi:small-conductance mechanosensitive channel